MFECRVVVADDDRELVEMIEHILTGAGYTVQTASDGVSAFQVVTEMQANVVMCDLRMPMDGHALIAALRAERPGVQTVLLTAVEDVAEVAAAAHADLYLQKPFDLADLLAVIGIACRRAEPAADEEQLTPGCH